MIKGGKIKMKEMKFKGLQALVLTLSEKIKKLEKDIKKLQRRLKNEKK